MQVSKTIDTMRSRDDVVELLCRDATLIDLFPDSDTEIVESVGDRRTTRTHYRALGRTGVVTFHFDFMMDGNIRFEKVCDGNVWKELRGMVSVDELESGARVTIEMKGRTRALVPELTIRGPMEEQIGQMAKALARLFESGV